MRYVIVTIEWCNNHGIRVPEYARKSVDGSKVILHEGFIAPVLTGEESLQYYMHDSKELNDILSSTEWSKDEQI